MLLVDFQKAFDSVWRHGLWYKPIEEVFNGKVKVIVKYDKIKYYVFSCGKRSEYLSSFKGVRQRENLSPFLFLFCLNGIEDCRVDHGYTAVNVNLDFLSFDLCHYIKLVVLLYTGDAVLLSDTKDGLQKALDALSEYCVQWKHRKTTKVLVFNSRKNEYVRFMYGEGQPEIVNSFTHPGIVFSRPGLFFWGGGGGGGGGEGIDECLCTG